MPPEREDYYDDADADEVEEEQAPDPLAELPEEPEARKAALAAYLDGERERLAAEARQAAEADLQRHKSELNARAKERLQDRFGIEWREDGEFVVKDPLRALANLQGGDQKPPEDARPDPVYDPDAFVAWAERQAEAKAEAKVAPVLQRLERVERLFTQNAASGVQEQASAVLEKSGLGHWTEHPDYQERLAQALGQLDAEALRDPKAVRFAAHSVIGMLDEERLPPTRTRQAPPQGADGRFVSPSRSGLGQTTPPRGYGRQPASTFTDEERSAADLAGMTVEEYRKYSSEETAWA